MLSCAVIGCGPGGMAAAAALRQAGLMVTVFEMAPKCGGIWASDATHTHTERGLLSPIPPAMRCAIPKDLMAFSDLRMYMTTPQFPHYSAVSDYLRRYAEERGVNSITRFNTKVESVRYDEAQGVWKLISVGLVNSDAYEWAFDRVVVATGQTHAPRYPPEAEALRAYSTVGTVTHSCMVKNARDFARRKVVVVGDGVSAYDMCQQLMHVGADVIHSTRLEKEADPTPPLLSFEGMVAGGDAAQHVRRSANLSGLFASLPLRGSKEHHANEVIAAMMRHREGYRAPRRVGRIIRHENGGVDGNAAAVGDGMSRDLLVHDDPTRPLSASQIIADLDSMGAGGRAAAASEVPSEELLVDVDAVIFATGFHTRYPFLPPEMRAMLETAPSAQQRIEGAVEEGSAAEGQKAAEAEARATRGLYRGCLWAANPTIGVIGAVPDALPPFMVMEAQANFLGRALTGKAAIPPSAARMMADDKALAADRPALASFFPERGMGLGSSQYYSALMAHQSAGGVPALREPESFAEAIFRRKWWFASTWFIQSVNRLRGLAPLKRRQQHVLFSNKI